MSSMAWIWFRGCGTKTTVMNFKMLFHLIPSGILFSINLHAQAPVSGFSVSSHTICLSDGVQILDQSLNSPSAWSYSLNGVQTSTVQDPELTFTATGTYTIDQESSNGFGTSGVYTETILVQSLPVVTISGNTLVCATASTTLTAGGADTYTWDSGSNFNTIIVNPSTSTNYSVTGTSTITGCSNSSSVTVNILPIPNISISNATICPGESYTLSPSGASSYTYSGGSQVVTPFTSTSYTVTGIDSSNGCTNSVVVSISVNAITVTAPSGSICSGQSFTITPSGATDYSISGGVYVVSPTVSTTYTIFGSNVGSSCTGSTSVTVSVTPAPGIVVNSGSVCPGASFTLNPLGASNYIFSSGSAVVTPTATTSYTITGIDINSGCTGSVEASVTVYDPVWISASSGTICLGQSFDLNPTGAYSYSSTSGGLTVSPQTSSTYTITGVDIHGCAAANAAIATVIVSGAQPTLVILTSQIAICIGQTATLTALGGNSYTWSTGATSSTAAVSPTVSTIFTLIGADPVGCTAGASIIQYVANCTTGISEIFSDLHMSVYPNPTNGTVYVENSHEMELSISNTFGALFLKQKLEPGKNTIDLDGAPSGIYFFQFKEDNSTKTMRIIKQ